MACRIDPCPTSHYVKHSLGGHPVSVCLFSKICCQLTSDICGSFQTNLSTRSRKFILQVSSRPGRITHLLATSNRSDSQAAWFRSKYISIASFSHSCCPLLPAVWKRQWICISPQFFLTKNITVGCARFASPAGLIGLEGTDIAMLYALLASKPGTPVDAGTDDEGACCRR